MNFKQLELNYLEEDKIEELLKKRDVSRTELKSRVALLKTWLDGQPHLPHYPEENMLQIFLWCCKFSLETAKEKLDSYFSFRRQLPEIFTDRDPSSGEISESTKYGKIFPLPQLTKEGYRVVYATVTTDIQNFSFTTICKLLVNTCDVLLLSEPFSVGQFILLDGKNVSMAHTLKIQPMVLKYITHYIQKVIPTQIKGIFVINASLVTELIHKMFIPLLSKKIQNRIHIFNGDYDELYNFIDKRILPSEYGGEDRNTDELSDAWNITIQNHKQWLTIEGTLLTDESKRPEKDKYQSNGSFFGEHGTFRRLEID